MDSPTPPRPPRAVKKPDPINVQEASQTQFGWNEQAANKQLELAKEAASYQSGLSQDLLDWQFEKNKEVADYQTQLALDTARKNQQMNMIDQSTPYADLSWDQTEDGRWVARQTLNPQDQMRLDANRRYDLTTQGTAQSMAEMLAGRNPMDFSTEAVEKRLFDLNMSRMGPIWQQRNEELRTRLANQGLTEGDEAWNKAYANLTQQENDQINQLLLGGRGQAFNEMLAERNQPIQEMLQFSSAGGELPGTGYIGTPQVNVNQAGVQGYSINQPGINQPGVAAPNSMGLEEANFLAAQNWANTQNQMRNNMLMNTYNQDVAQNNAIYGALGSLAGTALGGWAQGGWLSPF